MSMFSVAHESALLGKRASENRRAIRSRSNDVLLDLEFSDYGRSPRFVTGWWIVPGFIVSALLVFYAIG
jgi:hypothetical protein